MKTAKFDPHGLLPIREDEKYAIKIYKELLGKLPGAMWTQKINDQYEDIVISYGDFYKVILKAVKKARKK